MLHFIDKLIENFIKKKFHNQRDKIINKSLNAFKKKHPGIPTEELVEKFENEADRVYAIVDRSILRDRVKRASYGFWSIVVMGAILIGIFIPGSNIGLMAILSPFIFAFINYLTSMLTISISYNQRVKGAMDSVVIAYEKSLPAEIDDELSSVVIDFGNNEVESSTSSIVSSLTTVSQTQKNDSNSEISKINALSYSSSNSDEADEKVKSHIEKFCKDTCSKSHTDLLDAGTKDCRIDDRKQLRHSS